MVFGNDALKWYNVAPWDVLGLAVPNWSDDIQSQNANIIYLTEVMGRNLQAVMFRDDARQTSPPSINTLTLIHKLCVRTRDIMASRAVPDNVYKMESAHANPAPEIFKVYPTPYFTTRNKWMKDYCGLILTALTEAMQHQENANAIEISERFTGLVGQYVQRVYRLMCVELFQIPLADASAPGFTMTDEMLRSYNPGAFISSTEMIDTVPPIQWEPTEDDAKIITAGIPVTMLPDLPRYPNTVGVGGPPSSGTTKTGSGSTFAPPPTP